MLYFEVTGETRLLNGATNPELNTGPVKYVIGTISEWCGLYGITVLISILEFRWLYCDYVKECSYF